MDIGVLNFEACFLAGGPHLFKFPRHWAPTAVPLHTKRPGSDSRRKPIAQMLLIEYLRRPAKRCALENHYLDVTLPRPNRFGCPSLWPLATSRRGSAEAFRTAQGSPRFNDPAPRPRHASHLHRYVVSPT